jgi:hypothetical protein
MTLPDKDASPRPCEDTPPGFRLHNRDSRTAGVRDQLEIRPSKREQHASHHVQDGNHPVDTVGAVEIAGRSRSGPGKRSHDIDNPHSDAGVALPNS